MLALALAIAYLPLRRELGATDRATVLLGIFIFALAYMMGLPL